MYRSSTIKAPPPHPPKPFATSSSRSAPPINSSHLVQEPAMSPAGPDSATNVGTAFDAGQRSTRVTVIWGVVFGLLQAAAPVGLWWIRPTAVYGLSLVLIAAIYIGFAVADGRKKVIAVEVSVTTVFVLVGAVAVIGSPWVAVVGLIGHG